MSASTKCLYGMLGVSDMATQEEIKAAFETSAQAFETSKLAFEDSKKAFEVLGDAQKRGTYDRKRSKENERELKRRIETLEKELECKKIKSEEKGEDENGNRNAELEKLRMELGLSGGVGHFRVRESISDVGRDFMKEEGVRKVLQLISLGETKVNLKFSTTVNCEVTERGWTLQFKPDQERDSRYHLWISSKDRDARFIATAQEIDLDRKWSSERDLNSIKYGTRQMITCRATKLFHGSRASIVRFNITFL